MQYLCLIYASEGCEPQPGTAEGDQFMGEYYAYTEEVKSRGAHINSNALMPVQTATTVRVRDGKAETTDGPFAETKEQLGGYYLINAENLDEALKWASQIPAAEFGCVEVRPIMVFE